MADKGGSGRGGVCTRGDNTGCVIHSVACDALQVIAGDFFQGECLDCAACWLGKAEGQQRISQNYG